MLCLHPKHLRWFSQETMVFLNKYCSSLKMVWFCKKEGRQHNPSTRTWRFWHPTKEATRHPGDFLVYQFRNMKLLLLFGWTILDIFRVYIFLYYWLVVWNMNFIFSYIGNNSPNRRTHIFQRGRYTTNQIIINHH